MCDPAPKIARQRRRDASRIGGELGPCKVSIPNVGSRGALRPRELQQGIDLLAVPWRRRPQTRADCVDAERPCPWCGCSQHLYLDVNPKTGTLSINFPDKDSWELAETCALDVADRGGHAFSSVGMLMNLTRERVRQVEVSARIQMLPAYKQIGLSPADILDRSTVFDRARDEDGIKAGDVAGLHRQLAEKLQELQRTNKLKDAGALAPRSMERELKQSKMSKFTGKPAKLICKVIRDSSMSTARLREELLELGVDEADIPSDNAINVYLRRQRALIAQEEARATERRESTANPSDDPSDDPSTSDDENTSEPLEGDAKDEDAFMAEDDMLVLESMQDAPQTIEGYRIFPDGSIWTSDAKDALALSRKILEGE